MYEKQIYSRLRKQSADFNLTKTQFDSECAIHAMRFNLPPAAAFVAAAREVIEDLRLRSEGTVPCKRCCETGRFITGMLNGQPTGPGGQCFRCIGKGYQNLDDRRRNRAYDLGVTP